MSPRIDRVNWLTLRTTGSWGAGGSGSGCGGAVRSSVTGLGSAGCVGFGFAALGVFAGAGLGGSAGLKRSSCGCTPEYGPISGHGKPQSFTPSFSL